MLLIDKMSKESCVLSRTCLSGEVSRHPLIPREAFSFQTSRKTHLAQLNIVKNIHTDPDVEESRQVCIS